MDKMILTEMENEETFFHERNNIKKMQIIVKETTDKNKEENQQK